MPENEHRNRKLFKVSISLKVKLDDQLLEFQFQDEPEAEYLATTSILRHHASYHNRPQTHQNHLDQANIHRHLRLYMSSCKNRITGKSRTS